ncbi:MAG: tyrosine-type recombinase/integrase [Porticoccaceae bacterium]
MSFPYRDRRCRESIYIGPRITNTILQQASDKLAMIRWEIAAGTFDYLKHFPNSRSNIAVEESRTGDRITIEKQLKDLLVHKQRTAQRSTVKDYSSAVYHHLIPTFGHLKLSELRPAHVRKWISKLKISNKRINNILIPLRLAYKDAYENELIDFNPMDRIRNLSLDTREPKPFTLKEISAILLQLKGQEKNLIQFAFWSGLRTSELIALEWKDVDFDNNRIYVRWAKVGGYKKTTKTKSGYRTVELNEASRTALESQRIINRHHEVVFLDPLHKEPWKNDQRIRKRIWIPSLAKASLPYRNPYQTRHSYASIMLVSGKNPAWISQQLGHSNLATTMKTYARWLPSINIGN